MAIEWKSVPMVAGATLCSRILGLFRDVLMFSMLGTGAVSSAFVLAFTFPNLFRRLLGEGALATALVPVMAEAREAGGAGRAFSLLKRVLLLLGGGTCVLALICSVFLLGWGHGLFSSYRSSLAVVYSAVLVWYLPLICTAALVMAALNLFGRFFVPSLIQASLNVTMVGSLLIATLIGVEDPGEVALYLCYGAAVGGLLQLVLPLADIRRFGWSWQNMEKVSLRPVFRLFLPGLAGAAVFQVNLLIGRLLAFTVNESAAGVLYLANRLVELPLGLIGFSVGAVAFPMMSEQFAKRQQAEAIESYRVALRKVLWLMIPASAGLMALAPEVLRVLFQWGLFDGAAVEDTVLPLRILSVGIPFYGLIGVSTKMLHASMDMRTAVWAGGLAACINLGLGLWWMRWGGASGLAAANLVACIIQGLTLHGVVAGRYRFQHGRETPVWLQYLAAGAGVCLVCLALSWSLEGTGLDQRLQALIVVITAIPGSVVLYLWITGGWRQVAFFLGRSAHSP